MTYLLMSSLIVLESLIVVSRAVEVLSRIEWLSEVLCVFPAISSDLETFIDVSQVNEVRAVIIELILVGLAVLLTEGLVQRHLFRVNRLKG